MFEGWPRDTEEAWIFAYGSLMWNPCFPYLESQRVLLGGYHRALCILSIVNRGTAERPGLALGLDRGGSCRGLAFRIDAQHVAAAKADLWRREMTNAAYEPKIVPVELVGGARVPALTFVARRDHAQYRGDLPPEHAASLVAQGVGHYGAALDYLRNVARHLDEFGINDGPLHRVLTLAEAKAASARKHSVP